MNTTAEVNEEDIYFQYQSIIAPMIAELEVRDEEYPIEIFNEIRAVFTHLSRYKLQEREKDLYSAQGHMKRAILDCYKYMCVSIAEELRAFRVMYRKVDLKLADNGQFLPELDRREHTARDTYKKAKIAEIKKELEDEKIYQLFEDAYNSYKETDDFLQSSEEAILFASSHSKRSNLINIISIVVTVVSIIVAIAFAL